MKEELYKIIYIFVFTSLLFSTNNFSLNSHKYITNNYIPYKFSKVNIGCKVSNIENSYKKYIIANSWITDNLFIGGVLRSDNKKKANIIYGLNLGIKAKNELFNTFKLIYTLSYYSKRYSNYSRCKKIALYLENKNLAISYNYIFNNDYSDKYLNFHLFFNFEKHIIAINLKKNDKDIIPSLSISYKL